MWDNRSISISHFWCLIVGLLINRGCCLLGRRSMADPTPPPPTEYQSSTNHPTVHVEGKICLVPDANKVLWFCAKRLRMISTLAVGCVQTESSPLPRRRPANFKNTCLREEVAQLCFLPAPARPNRIREVNTRSRPITKTNFAFSVGENTLCD